MTDFDLICLGEPMVEFNAQADGRYLRGFGGDVSNTAIAAARQGAKVAIATRIGKDRFGDALMDLWQTEDVDTSLVEADADAPTGIYFVEHGAAGHHFEYRRSGSAASMMKPDTFDIGVFQSARILHFSGISLAISKTACETCLAAIAESRSGETLVSFDPNFRPALWPLETARPVLKEVLSNADIALPNIEEMNLLFGEKPAREHLETPATSNRKTAMKCGMDGVWIADGDERHLIEPVRVKAVDATGAGDCFNGVLLASMCEELPFIDCVRRANMAAALSVQGYGAVAPIPVRDDVIVALTHTK